jgi:menaquinone-dependent protoporphyrinogen IX oxidase
MKANISVKIVDLLTKELLYADFASSALKNEMKVYEKKYRMSWHNFINKFEKGEIGDEKAWFTWYGLALSTKDWDETKSEIKKAITNRLRNQ